MASIENLYEDEIFIKSSGFVRKKKLADLLYYTFALLSIGIIPLICWKNQYYLNKWFFEPADDEKSGTHLYLENKDTSFNVVRLIPTEHPFTAGPSLKFVHKHLQYYQDEDGIKPFRYFAFPFKKYSHLQLDEIKKGVSQDKANNLMAKFNDSTITVKKMGLFAFLVQELTNVFFLFQAIGIVLWFLESFWMYSVGVIVATTVFTTMNFLLISYSHKKLERLAACYTTVKVKREGEWKEVSGNALVPGDIIDLPVGGTIPCDCLLLSGEMLVNEAMLTGESVPQAKNAYVKEGELTVDKNSGNFLYAGTTLLQKRCANEETSSSLVLRTAFASEKGNLIRDILFPTPISFDFYRSGLKTISILSAIILILYIVMITNFVNEADKDAMFFLFITFDVILWLMPPDLPIYITTAKAFSLLRMGYKGIIGLFPDKILIAGETTTCFFDKTGTITESELNLKGIVLADNMNLITTEICSNEVKESNKFFQGMACCHSIIVENGNFLGDSLEIQMFKHSGWSFNLEKKHGADIFDTFYFQNETIKPVHTYEFSSEKQMMSSVVENREGKKFIYSKGAPEKILSRMNPATVPNNYMEKVESLAIQGLRVLALAYNELDAWDSHSERNEYEKDLRFLGFLVFENKLKSDSADALASLVNAKLKVRIISGDNPLTTVAVAYQSNILPTNCTLMILDEVDGNLVAKTQTFGSKISDDEVLVREKILFNSSSDENSKFTAEMDIQEKDFFDSEIAVTGKALNFFTNRNQNLPQFIIAKAKVYARVKPDQKAYVVKRAKDLGEVVSMCGDGSNDCTAIKAADVGISFTENEASLTAPFSSIKPSITAVEKILLEGRCTMQIAIDVFKIDVIGNVLKFIGVFLLSFNGTFPPDSHWLWITFVNGVPIMVLIGASVPYHKLVERRPDANLFSANNVASVLGQFALYTIPLVISYIVVNSVYPVPFPGQEMEGFDVTTIVFIIGFETVLLTISVFKGNPYKRHLIFNIPLLIALIVLFIIDSVVILVEGSAFDGFLIVYNLNSEERSMIYALCWVFFIVAFLYEHIILALIFNRKSKSVQKN